VVCVTVALPNTSSHVGVGFGLAAAAPGQATDTTSAAPRATMRYLLLLKGTYLPRLLPQGQPQSAHDERRTADLQDGSFGHPG